MRASFTLSENGVLSVFLASDGKAEEAVLSLMGMMTESKIKVCVSGESAKVGSIEFDPRPQAAR